MSDGKSSLESMCRSVLFVPWLCQATWSCCWLSGEDFIYFRERERESISKGERQREREKHILGWTRPQGGDGLQDTGALAWAEGFPHPPRRMDPRPSYDTYWSLTTIVLPCIHINSDRSVIPEHHIQWMHWQLFCVLLNLAKCVVQEFFHKKSQWMSFQLLLWNAHPFSWIRNGPFFLFLERIQIWQGTVYFLGVRTIFVGFGGDVLNCVVRDLSLTCSFSSRISCGSFSEGEIHPPGIAPAFSWVQPVLPLEAYRFTIVAHVVLNTH